QRGKLIIRKRVNNGANTGDAAKIGQDLAKGGLGGMLAPRRYARRGEAFRHMDHGGLQGAALGG
ncbi:MAG: hypothetical protein ACK56I_25675, partial [bacterium]